MRLNFVRTSLFALAGFALIASSTLSSGLAAAQNATLAPTTAATSISAATVAQGTVFPVCDPNATLAAPAAGTAIATAAATVAAAVPTQAGTPSPTATVSPQAGYLGVGAKQVQNCGAIILDLNPTYAADKAGIKINDVVVAVDGQPITSLDGFRLTVQSHKAGDTLALTIQRAGQQMVIQVTLTAIPSAITATQAATAAVGGPTASPAG